MFANWNETDCASAQRHKWTNQLNFIFFQFLLKYSATDALLHCKIDVMFFTSSISNVDATSLIIHEVLSLQRYVVRDIVPLSLQFIICMTFCECISVLLNMIEWCWISYRTLFIALRVRNLYFSCCVSFIGKYLTRRNSKLTWTRRSQWHSWDRRHTRY